MRTMCVIFVAFIEASICVATERAPKILRNKHNSSVITWIERSASFDENGRLRSEVAILDPGLTRNLEANADGVCTQFMVEPPLEHFMPSNSLEELTSSAAVAIAGTVVSVSEGFLTGFPGTLVGFRVTDAFGLGSASTRAAIADVGSVRYTFIGSAQIVTPHGAICSTTGRAVTIPRQGDSILIFSFFNPIDEAEAIIAVESTRHLVIERGAARLFTPANLIDDLRGLTIAEAMASVRKRTARSGSEK